MPLFSPWADPDGGTGGPDPPPWNCQIINFCHVEIFRQTASGNLNVQIGLSQTWSEDSFPHGMVNVMYVVKEMRLINHVFFS